MECHFRRGEAVLTLQSTTEQRRFPGLPYNTKFRRTYLHGEAFFDRFGWPPMDARPQTRDAYFEGLHTVAGFDLQVDMQTALDHVRDFDSLLGRGKWDAATVRAANQQKF